MRYTRVALFVVCAVSNRNGANSGQFLSSEGTPSPLRVVCHAAPPGDYVALQQSLIELDFPARLGRRTPVAPLAVLQTMLFCRRERALRVLHPALAILGSDVTAGMHTGAG